MRCFYHPDVEAVGTCKHCSRGLCPACASELEDGLACKGRHEEQVEQINALVAASGAVNARVGVLHYAQFAIYSAATLLLGAGAVAAFSSDDGIWLGLLALMGAGFFGLYAAATLKWIVVRRGATKTQKVMG